MKTTDRITDEMISPPRTQRNKVVNYLLSFALLVLTLATGLLLYWSFQNEDVLQVKNSPFPVRTIREHPTANGVIILSVDLCKQTSAVGRVRTSFVSQSRDILLPISEDRGPKGCNKVEVPVLIPSDTPADTYRVKFHVDYKINPLKTVVEEFESEPFIVDGQSNADLPD